MALRSMWVPGNTNEPNNELKECLVCSVYNEDISKSVPVDLERSLFEKHVLPET